MPRKVNIFRSLDWFAIVLYLLLVALGWINIYAAVYNEEYHSILSLSQKYGKQLLWIVASLLIIIAIILIDSRFYTYFAYVIYILLIILLISVLIFGKKVNGARSWFEISDLRIQPSEFAKFATSLALAKFLSSFNFKIHQLKNLAVSGFIIFFPSILIILQPDVGSALVYIAFILVLYREGLSFYVLLIALLIVLLSVISLVIELSYVFIGLCMVAVLITGILIELKHALFSAISIIIASFLVYSLAYFLKLKISLPYLLFIGLLAAGLFGYIMAYKLRLNNLYIVITFLIFSISYSYSVDYIFDNVLEKHQKSRVNVLLGFDDDLKGVGYNVHQSKIAIGSGGITGKGFLQGTQTKFDFVPEQSTDFIFCTVGEEWGFVGSFTVILLFTILLLRLIFLAERQRSSFSRIYGYGLISIIFVHMLINIGMTIGLAPVIGIPLPFLSYGGSSLWAFSILLFIFLRLDASRSELL